MLNFGETELEANVSPDDGSANWNSVNFDLDAALAGGLGEIVTLTIAVDTNSGSENIFVDNIEDVARNTVMMDDGFSLQNPTPIPYPPPGLDDANTVRMGDGVAGLVGVVRYSRGSGGFGDETYRIQPVAPVSFTVNAPRPMAPAVVGSLRVASFNVLNFFNDLDDGSGMCFPSFTANDCRGADSADEFVRQKTKLVQAISALDADVIGLIEIENDYPDGATSAIAELTAAINDAGLARCPRYAWVDPQGRVGGDAIAVGLLYCGTSVRLVQGSVGVLTDSALTALGLDHLAPVFDGVSTNRAPLAATFRQRITRGRVTIAVNHFKSKGDSGLDTTCDPDPSVDPNCDQGDGQGYWNAMRTNGSVALGTWLNSRGGRRDTLIIGDLNAYRQEDPIQTLIGGGYVDLVTEHANGEPYSFVFDGQAGLLDYALATPRIAQRTNSVDIWHSNADEPDGLDYNLDFGRPSDAFDGATPYRASDHDAVLVGISLPTNDRPVTIQFIVSMLRAAVNLGDIVGTGSTTDEQERNVRRLRGWLRRTAEIENEGGAGLEVCDRLIDAANRTDGTGADEVITGASRMELNELIDTAINERCP